jgi:hypothetical protein
MDGAGFSSQKGQKIILFSKDFTIGCLDHPELSPIVTQLGCEADHTPPTREGFISFY